MADDNLKRPTRRRVIIISKKMISNQVVPIANDKINSTTTAAQKESEDEEELDYTISFSGSGKIFGQGINPWRRAVWVAIVLISAGLTVYQVQDRVVYFLKTPISIHLTIMANESLEFPLTTICTREPFNHTAMELLRPEAAKILGKDPHMIQLPYDLLALMDLKTLWNNLGHNFNTVTKECWFGRMKPCDEVGQWRPVFTIMGPSCMQYKLNSSVSETGMFNGLYMQMFGEALTKPKLTGSSSNKNKTLDIDIDNNGWKYLFHPQNVNPALLIYDGDYMNPSSSVDVQVSLKEFNGLDVWHSPCQDNVTYTSANCELICLSNEIVKRVGCRLPFMLDTSPPSPFCSTPDSYKAADELLDFMIKDAQWKSSDCNCTRQCYFKNYIMSKEKVLAELKPFRLRFRAFYQDTTFEVAEEMHAYDLITLFCDIGSSMGLLLGASVLTWMEAIEWLTALCHQLTSSDGADNKSHRQRRHHPR